MCTCLIGTHYSTINPIYTVSSECSDIVDNNNFLYTFKIFLPSLTFFLIVCSPEDWQKILSGVGCPSIQLRDARYDQVVHMVTAANGAEEFYQLANNATRSESFELARELDTKAAQVCVSDYVQSLLERFDNSLNCWTSNCAVPDCNTAISQLLRFNSTWQVES